MEWSGSSFRKLFKKNITICLDEDTASVQLHRSAVAPDDIRPLHLIACLIPEHMFEYATLPEMAAHLFQCVTVSCFCSCVNHGNVVPNLILELLPRVHVDPGIKLRGSGDAITEFLSMPKHTLPDVHVNPETREQTCESLRMGPCRHNGEHVGSV
mmetsp:Transcript_41904/g.82148  ORF Transcript_41904/g.82148 Transcript_41904/m.82148 type:complete len:155 (+) Transcript_41904:55-519(+)